MLLKDKENIVFIDESKKYKSYISFLKILKRYDKECVFLSFGGRLSTVFPMLYILGYRNLYIYELNRIMGKSNKIAKPFCKKVFSYFPLSTAKNVKVIGHPQEDRKRLNYIKERGIKILVLTGSNGTKELYELFDKLKLEHDELDITISEPFKSYKFKSKIKRMPFINSNFYSNYDLIISRAGAGSIADVLRQNIPLVLCPSRHVKDDHQYANSEYLYDNVGIEHFDAEINIKDLYKLLRKELQYDRRITLIENYKKFQHNFVLNNLLESIDNEN